MVTRYPQEGLPIHTPAPAPHFAENRGLIRVLLLAFICAMTGAILAGKDKPPVQYKIPIPTPPDFSTLDWLQGQWNGKTLSNGAPGKRTSP